MAMDRSIATLEESIAKIMIGEHERTLCFFANVTAAGKIS